VRHRTFVCVRPPQGSTKVRAPRKVVAPSSAFVSIGAHGSFGVAALRLPSAKLQCWLGQAVEGKARGRRQRNPRLARYNKIRNSCPLPPRAAAAPPPPRSAGPPPRPGTGRQAQVPAGSTMLSSVGFLPLKGATAALATAIRCSDSLRPRL
jgi:hypothetical protein